MVYSVRPSAGMVTRNASRALKTYARTVRSCLQIVGVFVVDKMPPNMRKVEPAQLSKPVTILCEETRIFKVLG